MLSFRILFSQFLVNCAAARLTIILCCGRMREAGRPTLLPPAARSWSLLCCGHGTLLEWLVGWLRRDIWRLNVAFKAWRWQGTPQSGSTPVYTQDSLRDIYGSRSLIYLLLSKRKYLWGVALLFVSKHNSRMRRKILSTCPSVEKNNISKRQELQTHQEVDIFIQDFCFMRTIFFRPMHLKSSPGHWHGDLCSLED